MTLLLGFAAVNTGNNLLYLLVSALLGFMAVSGVLGKWNLSRLEARLDPADEIFAEHPTLLGIRLINRKSRLPTFLMEAAFEGRSVLFPHVDPRRDQRRNLVYTFPRRGRQVLPPVILRSRFPINFFIRHQVLATGQSLTVLPKPRRCMLPDLPDPGGRQGLRQSWLKGQDGDISRIGNYQGGEPLKHIHWKLSARHDTLKVKEFSAATQPPVVLDLAQMPGQNLEQRISAAVYLATRLLKAGRPVGLQTEETLFPPAVGRLHRQRLLEALATYGQN
ncbi:MAG TPA: DUF58 domain-containing protein [Desulfuromonadales bacterium]|nr:DUF58 domain-containing protein [Desulfuromonadales bacterium]